MKNISMDYSYLTSDLIKAIAKAYPNGFKDTDIIRLSEVNNELKDRIKVVLNDVVFLIKEADLNVDKNSFFDDEYFETFRNNKDANCDAEFCENDQ